MKPNQLVPITLATLGFTFTALVSPAFGQGALTPPSVPDHLTGPSAALSAGGLPQPTMKTLQQIEPRVDVLTLASEGNAQYVISRPGSYYLSAAVTTASDIAIRIDASSVTLDLNGFYLSHGGRAAGTGVRVADGAQSVTIRNGRVSGFSTGVNAFGIFTNKTKGCVVEDVQVSDCTGTGIQVGDAGVVRNCISNNNGGHGIFADNGSLVISSLVCGNAGSVGAGAIWVRNGCTVSNCGVRENPTSGVVAGTDCTLSLCTVSANEGSFGISAGTGCTLRQCVANQNVGTGGLSGGISVGTGSSVVGCTATGNSTSDDVSSGSQGVGIRAEGRSLVKDCTVEGNTGDGIRCESDCRIEQNTCVDSGLYGAGVRALGSNNRIDGNHCTGNRYGIRYEGTSNLVIRNSAHGNGLAIESGNFSGDGAANAVGPFIYMNSIADPGDDRPWGNFTKTPTIGQP